MTSLTNGKGQKKRRERKLQDEGVEKTITETLMKTGSGRRWVFLKLTASGIWAEDGQLDPQYMAWKAGLRNEGLRLQDSILRYTPELFTEMWRENNKLSLEIQQADEEDAAEENIDG